MAALLFFENAPGTLGAATALLRSRQRQGAGAGRFSAQLGRFLSSVGTGKKAQTLSKLDPSPESCELEDSEEFCGKDLSCQPNNDCSGCAGLTHLNNMTHTCVAEPPQFIKDFCQGDPDVEIAPGCYEFGLAMMGCIAACATEAGPSSPNTQGLYGICIKGIASGCPNMLCETICECEGEPAKCPEPCKKNCERYKSCVSFGAGGKANQPSDFQAYVDACIFNKPVEGVTLECGCA